MGNSEVCHLSKMRKEICAEASAKLLDSICWEIMVINYKTRVLQYDPETIQQSERLKAALMSKLLF
jgi:hypothetical protein